MNIRVIFSLIFVLLLASLVFFYFVPFDRIYFEAATNSNFSLIGEEKMQFYPNMRFPSPEISYQITDCPLQKENDMEYAFAIIENLTLLKFYPVKNNEKISIACQEKEKRTGDLFIAGEGGPTNITSVGEFNVIFNGEILLIRESNCPRPNIALHELLHVLGFDHSTNPGNIMYNITNCNEIIGQDMINAINELYSTPSYSDLDFSNASAVLNGKFLNINMTIRNIGLENSGKSEIIIYADGDEIKKLDLEPINIGYGRIISLQNLWVPKSNVHELELIINYNFDEINKENNKIKLEIKE